MINFAEELDDVIWQIDDDFGDAMPFLASHVDRKSQFRIFNTLDRVIDDKLS